MACTTKPLSPESRKPLHTQVVDLREERISLLEKNQKLKKKASELTASLEKASERVSELIGKVEEGDGERAKLQERLETALKDAAMKDALASQLRIEATTWQARAEQGDMDHTRMSAAEAVERRRSNEHFEAERFRLMGESASVSAELRAADEQWRRNASEAAAHRQLLENQRDDAVSRAHRAEEALATSLAEQRATTDMLTRTQQHANDEMKVLELRAGSAEKRWEEASRRSDEMARERLRLEYGVAKADEALAVAHQSKKALEAQLSDERAVAQQTAKREGTLRHQLDSAQWALSKQQREATAEAAERAALAERGALLQTHAEANMEATSRDYYLKRATDGYFSDLRQRAHDAAETHSALGAAAPPPVTPSTMCAIEAACHSAPGGAAAMAASSGPADPHELSTVLSPHSALSPSQRAAEAAARAAAAVAALSRAHAYSTPSCAVMGGTAAASVGGLEAAAASAVAAMQGIGLGGPSSYAPSYYTPSSYMPPAHSMAEQRHRLGSPSLLPSARGTPQGTMGSPLGGLAMHGAASSYQHRSPTSPSIQQPVGLL